ncbi:MAG: thioredoxin [Spirochaetes bacterium]|nr:thioredoxin [Spirochaetota bacterium]
MGNLIEINESNFQSEVLDAKGKVLADFWAPWCGPCRMLAPILENLSKSDEISAKIVKVNTDNNQTLAAQFGIQSIPTMILFVDGKESERIVGVQPENVLKEKLK